MRDSRPPSGGSRTAGGLSSSASAWLRGDRPSADFADDPAGFQGQQAGDDARLLSQRIGADAATRQLWAEVRAAEKEYQAAQARLEPLQFLDPSAYPEAEQATTPEVKHGFAEAVRHELDAFPHPKRYFKWGRKPEALDRFWRQPSQTTRRSVEHQRSHEEQGDSASLGRLSGKGGKVRPFRAGPAG